MANIIEPGRKHFELALKSGRHLEKMPGPWEQAWQLNINFCLKCLRLAAVVQWIRHWSSNSEVAGSILAGNWEKKIVFLCKLCKLAVKSRGHLEKMRGPWELAWELNTNFWSWKVRLAAVAQWITYWTADSEIASSTPDRKFKTNWFSL